MTHNDFLQTNLLNVPGIEYTIILPTTYTKTLYWLHGRLERSKDILSKSNLIKKDNPSKPNLEELAQKYHVAIIIPDVPDTYYLNQTWNNCYTEDFLIKEFIPFVTEKYHLSSNKEDTFIAGASMGGFGSLLLGSHHYEVFGKIVSISGAFIIDDILLGNPEVVGGPDNFPHFQKLFGDIPSLIDSYERNPEVSALLAIENQKLPPVFMACGTEDLLLIKRNEKLFKKLSNAGADVLWKASNGRHDWKYYNSVLEDVFVWLINI